MEGGNDNGKEEEGPREDGEESDEDTVEGGEDDDGVSDNLGGEVASPPLASSLQSSQNSMQGVTPISSRQEDSSNSIGATTTADAGNGGKKVRLAALDTDTTSADRCELNPKPCLRLKKFPATPPTKLLSPAMAKHDIAPCPKS